jgi:hypothetical protein
MPVMMEREMLILNCSNISSSWDCLVILVYFFAGLVGLGCLAAPVRCGRV